MKHSNNDENNVRLFFMDPKTKLVIKNNKNRKLISVTGETPVTVKKHYENSVNSNCTDNKFSYIERCKNIYRLTFIAQAQVRTELI